MPTVLTISFVHGTYEAKKQRNIFTVDVNSLIVIIKK